MQYHAQYNALTHHQQQMRMLQQQQQQQQQKNLFGLELEHMPYQQTQQQQQQLQMQHGNEMYAPVHVGSNETGAWNEWTKVCDNSLDESESWWASSDDLLPFAGDDELSEGTACVSQPVSPKEDLLKYARYTSDDNLRNVKLEEGCDVYFKRPIKAEPQAQQPFAYAQPDTASRSLTLPSVSRQYQRVVPLQKATENRVAKRRRTQPTASAALPRAEVNVEIRHHEEPSQPQPQPQKQMVSASPSRKPASLREIHPNAIDLNPRDFQSILRALGAQLVARSPQEHHRVELIVPEVHGTTLPAPRTDRIRFIQPDKTFVMGSTVPLKDRRRYDSFCDQTLESGETTFWCDQGNAHCMLDCSKPLQESAIDGKHVNPRTIQVAHALARRVSGLTQMERPVIKSFYYALCARPSSKSNSRKIKGSLSGSWPLGLHKHIYVLCEQSVDDRHKILQGSQIWLVRYFVKGKLHPELDRFIL